MDRAQLRVLVLAAAAVASVIASTFFLDWYVAKLAGAVPMGLDAVKVDLREVSVCSTMGPCGVVPLSMSGGSYPTAAAVTFWASLVFAASVAYQAGTRIIYGESGLAMSKGAHGLGAVVALSTIVAGYVVGLDLGPATVQGIDMTVERGWGPHVMILGIAAGNAALYYARREDAAEPTHALAPAAAAYVPLAERQRGATRPPPMATTPAPERAKAATTPPPTALAGKVRFATLSAEVTRAGIDARREDGAPILVLWRDVVGIVARRLPPPEGAPFVDIVSTAGSTLRVLPWTRLTGDPVAGADELARTRAVAQLLVARCPDAQLDGATRAYLAGTEPPPQLPDAATLAAHDERLA